jgi:hypothetical protein
VVIIAGAEDVAVQALHIGDRIAQPDLGDDVREDRRNGRNERDRLAPAHNAGIGLDAADEPRRPDPPSGPPKNIFRERDPHEGVVDGGNFHRRKPLQPKAG